MGLCVTNNVVTSPTSPYPSGYCDYRLFFDSSQRGFGGGCQSGGDYGVHTESGGYLINEDVLYEIFFENGNLKGKITKVSDGTVLFNQTITPPKDYINYHFALFLFNNTTVNYKEVKIKPL